VSVAKTAITDFVQVPIAGRRSTAAPPAALQFFINDQREMDDRICKYM